MAKLLYIEASPRKERSHSITVAEAFLAAYKAKHPEDTVEYLDLWHTRLPEFDDEVIGARYAILGQTPRTTLQVEAWSKIAIIFDHFQSADKYIFAVPMWNFHIPLGVKEPTGDGTPYGL